MPLVLRWVECIVLFVLIPILFALDFLPGNKVFWLVGFTMVCLMLLLRDTNFDRSILYQRGTPPRIKTMCIRLFVAGVGMAILVIMVNGAQLFAFPRSKPVIWVMVMILYPFISALPQELIYRTFFFHRYARLFPGNGAMVWASTVVFSFLHIMYDNVFAMVLTLIGGYILAKAYEKHRSLFWVAVEHAGYGLLAFTLGLGKFFYEGPVAPLTQ